MLCRNLCQDLTSRQYFSIGIPLLLLGSMLCGPWSLRAGLPPFWDGFLLGIGAVMTGCSIPFNVLGLCRFREERQRR